MSAPDLVPSGSVLAPMAPVAHRVVARRRETADTATLVLAPVRGDRALPVPRPGQFHMLSAFGVGEVPISVSGVGGDDGSVEHTVRAVGAVTDALVASAVGDVIGSRGPFGVGWDLDVAAGRDAVIVAGGIGLAPLRPVVEALVAPGSSCRRVVVLVGARTPADVCFGSDLRRWADRGAEVHVTVDRAEGPGAEAWLGGVGVVTQLVPAAGFDPSDAVAYVCGPEVMMRFAVRALADRGLVGDQVQVSAERSMTCGIGHCGHCQLGPLLICRDGPVVAAPTLLDLVAVKER